MLLYIAQEGRGIGLLNKLRAYELQDHGRDTVEANLELGFPPDLRDYGIGAQILVRPRAHDRSGCSPTTRRRSSGLEGYGLSVVERVPIEVAPGDENLRLPPRPSATRWATCCTTRTCASSADEAEVGRESRPARGTWRARAPPPVPRPRGPGVRMAASSPGSTATSASACWRGRGRGWPSPACPPEHLDERWVPGAFELPLAARTVARTGRYAAIIALGAVVRGETPHFDHICGAAAWGLTAVRLETGVPCAFGVLTTENRAQAEARAGGRWATPARTRPTRRSSW